jgi:hypothetical protein
MFIATIEEKSQTVSGVSECCKMQGNPMTSFVYRLLYATGFVYLKSKIAIHNPVSSNLNSHKLFYNLYWLFQATTKRHKTGSYS